MMTMEPVPEASPIRPCFLSAAQRDEFEMIVGVVARGLWSCGLGHAWGVARSLAGLTHDPSAVMRCARAEHASGVAHRLAEGRSLL